MKYALVAMIGIPVVCLAVILHDEWKRARRKREELERRRLQWAALHRITPVGNANAATQGRRGVSGNSTTKRVYTDG